jgi:hypothetical protein
MTFFETTLCVNRTACVACRTRADFRQQLFANGSVTSADFACPYGIVPATAMATVTQAATARATTPEELAAIAADLRQNPGTGAPCCGQS